MTRLASLKCIVSFRVILHTLLPWIQFHSPTFSRIFVLVSVITLEHLHLGLAKDCIWLQFHSTHMCSICLIHVKYNVSVLLALKIAVSRGMNIVKRQRERVFSNERMTASLTLQLICILKYWKDHLCLVISDDLARAHQSLSACFHLFLYLLESSMHNPLTVVLWSIGSTIDAWDTCLYREAEPLWTQAWLRPSRTVWPGSNDCHAHVHWSMGLVSQALNMMYYRCGPIRAQRLFTI